MDAQFKQLADQIVAERQGQLAQEDAALHAPVDPSQNVASQLGFKWNDYAQAFDIPSNATPEAQAQEQAADEAEVPAQAVAGAILAGPVQAALETDDFLEENPAIRDALNPADGIIRRGMDLAGIEDPRRQAADSIKQGVNDYAQAARTDNAVAGIAGGMSQFITGLIGAGKIMQARYGAEVTGKLAKTSYEIGKGILAGAISMDPHEDRLSNLIQEFPALENPVADYLSAKPEDSNAEGRLKNALEGAGLDVALAGVFALGLKAVRYARRGEQQAAAEVVDELAQPQVVEAVKVAEAPPQVTLVPPGEKPRVRVKATTDAIPGKAADDLAVGVKPKVRVKANSSETPSADMLAAAERDIGDSISEPIFTASGGKLPANTEKLTTLVPEGISDDQLRSIMRGTEFDLLATEQAGSRVEAVSQGYKFAPENSIPWQKLNTPEDVSTLIANTTRVLQSDLDLKKGGAVLTDATVERQVRNIAKFFNEAPEEVIGMISKAGDAAAGMVKQMEAGYLLSNRMFLDAWDVTNKIRWGNLAEFGGDAQVAMQEARRRLQTAFEVYSSAQSMRSAAGRSMRRMRSEFAVRPDLVEQLKSLDDDKLLKLMDSTGGDPRKIKEMSTPGFLRRVLDEAQFSMRNGLLWLYPTHVVNLTGNVYMQVARPLEKAIGAAFLSPFKKTASPILRQATKEFYYTVAAVNDGWSAGVEAFLKGDSKLAPHASDWLDTNDAALTAHQALGMPTFRPFDSIENLWHNLHLSSLYRNTTGLPTRALGAQDEFFKTLRYRAVVQARSAVDAMDLGLRGQELKDFVEDRLKKAFDLDGRAVDREALHEAQTATYNQELLPNTIGAAVRNARSQVPALGLVLPYVKTPVNVLRYSWKYTPGLNLLQGEYRQAIRGLAGVERQAQAVGQMALGSLFMMSATMFASNGMITGAGPTDRKLKQQLVEQGWKPYSFHWTNADGTETYLPYSRFDPLGMVMGMTADLYAYKQAGGNDEDYTEAATATTIALAQNFSERTFLLNANQLIRALAEPDPNMSTFLGNMAAATIPASSALRGYANSDPYLREARGIVDRALKDIPGFSDNLPPRRDVFGEPLLRRIGLTTNYDPDVVEAEHNRMILETGEGISVPGPTHNGVDLRDVTLSDGQNAYDIYQQFASNPFPGAGLTLKVALRRLIESDAYQMLPDGEAGVRGTRLNAFAGVIQDYRKAGYQKLLKEYPEVGRLTRRKQAEAAGQLKENITGTPGAASELMKALGY